MDYSIVKDLENFSDEELVVMTRSENNQLYAEIVKRYQNKLLRYVRSLAGDDSECYDLVQKSFINAYKNLNGFDTKQKFSSWIYRIVHNEAMNYFNKKKRLVYLDYDQWDQIVDEKYDMEEMMLKKELKTKVYDCFKKLPEDYKEIMLLFFMEEKSYQDISDILKIPIGTVGTRINRGKKYFKQLCDRRNFQE